MSFRSCHTVPNERLLQLNNWRGTRQKIGLSYRSKRTASTTKDEKRLFDLIWLSYRSKRTASTTKRLIAGWVTYVLSYRSKRTASTTLCFAVYYTADWIGTISLMLAHLPDSLVIVCTRLRIFANQSLFFLQTLRFSTVFAPNIYIVNSKASHLPSQWS